MIFLYGGLGETFKNKKVSPRRGGKFVSVPVKGVFLQLKNALDGYSLERFLLGAEEFYKKTARFSSKR